MKVIALSCLASLCLANSLELIPLEMAQSGYSELKSQSCAMLHSSLVNESQYIDPGTDCEKILITHSESVSGGYCLASMTAAGYYRAGFVNPVVELLTQLSGSHGNAPIMTGSNSGGTMFIIRYFTFRDTPVQNKWTFPCYLLNNIYKSICFFHGNFGIISEECFAETQNIVSIATAVVYGGLIHSNGGPLGVVSSYCSVYFSFLSNLPLDQYSTNFQGFWMQRSHWNQDYQTYSSWVVAFTMVNPLVASDGTVNYNYGFNSYLSRGMSPSLTNTWYSNMSVYTASSISANTLSAFSIIPFSFAGKEWDMSGDVAGTSTLLKVVGLLISYLMLKKLIGSHTVLITRAAPQCESDCPLLDGGFTDNGPITPVLSAASKMENNLWPRQMSLLGPANTMESIKYLLGTGPLGLTGGGLNLCPFTQVSICRLITEVRTLIVPLFDFDTRQTWRDIDLHYEVFRPDQQAIKAFCSDPLIYDHFVSTCKADGICHMALSALPGKATDIVFTIAQNNFVLSMVWLSPTSIASRFVHQYIPSEMLAMKYYANMDHWFPDFAATAPQKGGVGFTKVAGHSLLDYLTYLVTRLIASEVQIRMLAANMYRGELPPCGYDVYSESQKFNTAPRDQTTGN